MSEKQDSKSFAVVLVRGQMSARSKVRETLVLLGFTRKNHCAVFPANETFNGMLNLCKDYITWGTISAPAVEQLLSKRGEIADGKKLSDDYVSKNSKFKSIKELAAAIAEGKARVGDVKGARPVFRLSPPRSGFGQIKRPFPKGSIGFRKDGMDELVLRMV